MTSPRPADGLRSRGGSATTLARSTFQPSAAIDEVARANHVNMAEEVEESALSKPRITASPWIVLAALGMGEFMILLDVNIVGVALPKLSAGLNAGLDQLLWVVNAYTLVFAVLLIAAGRLGDMLGPKKMFLSGLFVFTAASAACGLAQTANQLILFRVIQAVGGAALMPQTLSVITSIFPPAKRGAAFGIWSAISGLAAATGPTLGGLLTSGFSWRAVFFPNVPVGVLALLLAFLMMPEVTIHRKRSLDLVGIGLGTVGLFALIYALIEGQKYNWGTISTFASFSIGSLHAGLISIPTIFLLSALCLVALVIWETRQEEPFLPLSLFRDRNFSIGNIVALFLNFNILSVLLPLTLLLQTVLGLSPVEAGVAVLPFAIASMCTAPPSGKLVYKLNGKFFLVIGLTVFGIGAVLLGLQMSTKASGASFTLPLVVTGLGMGMTVAPMTALAMRNIAPTAAGAASGFINTIRQVGSALGSASVGAILANRLATELNSGAASAATRLPQQYRASFIKGVSSISTGGLTVGVGQTQVKVPPNTPASVAHQIQALGLSVFNQAFVNAAKPAVYAVIPIAALGAAFALFMRTPRVVPVPVPEPVPVPAGAPAAYATPQAIAPTPLSVTGPLGISDTVVLPTLSMTQALRIPAAQPLRLPFLERLGDGSRAEYPIQDTISLGRLPTNTVVVDDPKASRRHAEISMRGTGLVIRDLGSANGTVVNGQQISGEQQLRDGDTVKIGDTSFTIHNELELVRPRLTLKEDGAVREYPITPGLVLGRAPTNDIVVPDSKVSRRHAVITIQNGEVMVRDLESLNGTKVNGEPVVWQRPLREGDTLTVGDTSFVYHSDLEAVPAQ